MEEDIRKLRLKIDTTDEQILNALCDRVKVCEAIGAAKKAQGLSVHDAKREKQVYAQIKEKAAKLGLNPIQVEAVYHEIVNMCSSVQE